MNAGQPQQRDTEDTRSGGSSAARLAELVAQLTDCSPEQALALMKSLAAAKTPDALMIASDIASAVMNLLVRPLLTTAFIVLYYDAKARRGR